jgi:hypothetical protein
MINRLKDAVFVRLKTNQLRSQMIKTVHAKRKETIEKEKHQLIASQRNDMKDLMFTVQQALNKLISLRRKEFEK